MLISAAAQVGYALTHAAELPHPLGGDFLDYRAAAARWLADGTFYQPWQLEGRYEIRPGAILYPSALLILLVPFTVLPGFLWWLVPIATLLGVVAWHRPPNWSWPLLALPLNYEFTTWTLIYGTPTLWIAAAVALGTLRPPLTALALVKPSVFPVALIGSNDRRWWLIAAGLVLASLPMARDYVRALTNSNGDLLYSLHDMPLLLVPIAASAVSTRRPGAVIGWVRSTRPKRVYIEP